MALQICVIDGARSKESKHLPPSRSFIHLTVITLLAGLQHDVVTYSGLTR